MWSISNHDHPSFLNSELIQLPASLQKCKERYKNHQKLLYFRFLAIWRWCWAPCIFWPEQFWEPLGRLQTWPDPYSLQCLAGTRSPPRVRTQTLQDQRSWKIKRFKKCFPSCEVVLASMICFPNSNKMLHDHSPPRNRSKRCKMLQLVLCIPQHTSAFPWHRRWKHLKNVRTNLLVFYLFNLKLLNWSEVARFCMYVQRRCTSYAKILNFNGIWWNRVAFQQHKVDMRT